MLETSARLLRLLGLLQARRDWSGADLADRLEVTVRTVRRDVDKLRSLGYPVHAVSGIAGGYRLGAGAALPPLLLDDEEAVAVAVGLRTAATGPVAGMAEASVRALAKLEQVLPPRLRPRVNAVASFTVPMPDAGPTVDPDTLLTLASACRDLVQLRFDYVSGAGSGAGSGSLRGRLVEPYRLVHTGRRWYLLAWDTDRRDWRTFRVDRIDSAVVVGPRFAPRDPPAEDIAAYVSERVSAAPYRWRARILLKVPLRVAAELVPPTVGRLDASGASCVLTTGSDSLDMLALHLGLLDVDFEVLEPPELAERVQRLAARFGSAFVRP